MTDQLSIFSEDDKLKDFMEDHFDFASMKKSGVYPKELKKNDYEGQAAIICRMFSYESIYQYGTEEIVCHISYAHPVKHAPLTIPEHRTFVEVIFPQNREKAVIIPFNKK